MSEEAKALTKKLGLSRYGSAHKINIMLMNISGKVDKTDERSMVVTDIMNKVSEEARDSPHDDEEWQRLCDGVRLYDDVNGGYELDKPKVIEARKLEIQFLKKIPYLFQVGQDRGRTQRRKDHHHQVDGHREGSRKMPLEARRLGDQAAREDHH